MQAAFLRVRLKYLNDETQKRRKVAKHYLDKIKNSLISLPKWENIEQHVWHLFVLRTQHREVLQQYLTEQGMQSLIHYPIASHQQQAYKEWRSRSYPLTEAIHQEAISLPIDPTISEGDVQTVIDILNNFKIIV